MKKRPFRDLKLAAKEGKILHPEDLSSQDLSASVLDGLITDVQQRAMIERSVEAAVRVGNDLIKVIGELPPIARVMVVKGLYQRFMYADRKTVDVLKNSGIWDAI